MTIYPRRGALLCAVLAGALLLHLAPPSLATQPASDPKALHAKGLEAFKAGRFSEAGKAFMEAQALDPSASLLWNAARSFDKAGENAKARSAYAAYVAHTDANPDKSARASKWLDQHPAEAEARPTSVQAAPKEEVARATVVIKRSSDSKGSHTGLGWTLVSFGAAATIGATIAMVLAQGSGAETETLVWDKDYEETLARHRSLSATAEQQELAAWLTYGAAVGLVSTGLFLLLRGGETSEVSTGFTSIQVNPHAHGLSASGTWRF